MAKKNITIDDLAIMVAKGFQGTDKEIADGFSEVNNRLDRIENILLKQHSQKIEFLEKRIHHLEEALSIK